MTCTRPASWCMARRAAVRLKSVVSPAVPSSETSAATQATRSSEYVVPSALSVTNPGGGRSQSRSASPPTRAPGSSLVLATEEPLVDVAEERGDDAPAIIDPRGPSLLG